MSTCIGCGMEMGEAFRKECTPGCGDDTEICPHCGDRPVAEDEKACEVCLEFAKERQSELDEQVEAAEKKAGWDKSP